MKNIKKFAENWVVPMLIMTGVGIFVVYVVGLTLGLSRYVMWVIIGALAVVLFYWWWYFVEVRKKK